MKKLLIAIPIVVLALLGGIAYASIPGPDGVIHGCYKTGNPATGAVIVIDSEETCPSGFTELNWNQIGPQGPAGQDGVSGYEAVSVQHVAEQLPDGRWEADSTAFCPAGKAVLGGGFVYGSDETYPNVTVTENFPSSGLPPTPYDKRWAVAVVADVPGTLEIRAICALVTQ